MPFSLPCSKEKAFMDVSFIGSGNLAWHLAPALDNAGYSVREVYSRNTKNAEALVGRLYQAETKLSLDFSSSASHIFIIAVSDDAIDEIAQELILPDDSILVHTSGSQSLSVLGYASTPNIGVFYPLQTFSKVKKVDFSEIPIFIESENAETGRVLLKMAQAISKQVKQISSEDRKALHVAAVFASNFTNHILALSKEILEANKLSFDMVKPLIVETINKSLSIGPEKAQTGPAKRGDMEILDRHMEFLQHDETLAEIYRLISQNIIDKYSDD
jgi:predicted short-subunit dehydrogenase-like oxidoreductase (DUF2520 family)